MFNSLWNDLVKEYRYSNRVIRLIFINVAVFVLINIIRLFLFIFTGPDANHLMMQIQQFLGVSADPLMFITRPWTWVTYMFMHAGFFHLLFNMLFLYWFGKITADLLGNRRIYPLYFLGAWMGIIFYIIFAILTPLISSGSTLIGASAGVLAIVTAAGAISPDYEIRLIFIGNVKLKYLVLAMILLDLFSIGVSNTGGHIAHLGGVFWGFLYVHLLRRGIETGTFINRVLEARLTPRFKNKDQETGSYKSVIRQHPATKKRSVEESDFDAKIDTILDKIGKVGYEKLTDEEKKFLEEASLRKD